MNFVVNMVANLKNCGWIISKILTKRTKEMIFFRMTKVIIVAVRGKLRYLIYFPHSFYIMSTIYFLSECQQSNF